jgi:hypothetical protein
MRIEVETRRARVRLRPQCLCRKSQDEKRRYARLAALFFCCLLMAACPASGGDLLALETGEGELRSVYFKNDTLVVRHGDVAITARGDWGASDASTWLQLEVSNAGAEAVVLSLDKFELLNISSRELLTLRSLAELKDNGAAAIINERSVTIEGGRNKKYFASFFIKSGGPISSVSRDVEGQTVLLKLPVSIQNETRPLADFLFSFKYVEYQH